MKGKSPIYTLIALAVGICLGILLARGCSDGKPAAEETGTIYTCSMDPQVRQDHPGKCPICGMDLIPLADMSGESSGMEDLDGIMLSDEAIALADVQTTVVGTGATVKETRLFGRIEADERLEQVQSAYIDGRIEKLYVNAVGDKVAEGQDLAVIYSPALLSAEQELLQAKAYQDGLQKENLVDAAIQKLELMQIDREQIDEVIRSGKASPYITLKANTGGVVTAKLAKQGDYVAQGQALLKISDLGKVWAVFRAYESDLPFLKEGSKVVFTSESLPGKNFSGRIDLIEPVLDGSSRTAGVRVPVQNPGGELRPEMIVSGYAASSLKGYDDEIVVPKSAVLWTGSRSVVYVKDEGYGQPTFVLREVTLGPSLPDAYIILDGLAEGEEIVSNGTFAVDASAQLAGKRSMMDR